MHKYVVDGREHWANASNPQIPAAFAPVIAGFVSLNNFDIPPAVVRLPLAARLQQAEITSPGATFNSSTYAVGPYDFATIYNALPLWNSTPPIDGTGQTIALAEESDVCTAGSPDFANPDACGSPARDDIQAFRSRFDLPLALAAGGQPVQVIVNGPNPGLIAPTSSANPATLPLEGEAILDADVAGGVAKGAQIDLVVASSDGGNSRSFSLRRVCCRQQFGAGTERELSELPTTSWDVGTFYFDALWEQAAAQGITVVVSAGDTGSAGCDEKGASEVSHGLAVNGIAATPFNVAVGGTDFNDAGEQSMYWKSSGAVSALSYIPEVPWNNSGAAQGLSGCGGTPSSSSLTDYAGGGGQSSCVEANDPYCPKPAWRSGPAVTGLASTDGSRDIPDVSLFSSDGSSSHSAYVICESDLNKNDESCASSGNAPPFSFVGGTSASAPAFAGIMTMVDR